MLKVEETTTKVRKISDISKLLKFYQATRPQWSKTTCVLRYLSTLALRAYAYTTLFWFQTEPYLSTEKHKYFFISYQRYLSRHCATIRRISLISFHYSRLHTSSWITDFIKAIVIFIPPICECIIKFSQVDVLRTKPCSRQRSINYEKPRNRDTASRKTKRHK